MINAGLLNLPWMQLRRVAISVFVAFLALWRGEITASEAHTAVQDTLHVLAVFQTRWKSAYKTQEIVMLLAERSGRSQRIRGVLTDRSAACGVRAHGSGELGLRSPLMV